MVSYDSPGIASKKIDYIKHHRLGGAMFWESSGDQPVEQQGSLINLVAQGLGGYEGRNIERTPNCLEYPQSKYDNLRNSMPGE